MGIPLPSRRVRGSATGRPIMALLDLLGRRMALRILWELRSGALTFRALQQAAGTNPSVLNARLGELREAGIVEHGAGGYRLAPRAEKLLQVLLPLHVWADGWAEALTSSANARGQAGSGRRSGPAHGARRTISDSLRRRPR